jgi:hypothetical protein
MLKRIYKSVQPLIVLTALLVAAPPALAHSIGFSCKLIGNIVRIEAYFSDDTPAIDARIVFRNEQHEIVAEGRTDDHGVWTCARPPAAQYEVTVDAGAGHRASQRLTIPEPSAQPESQAGALSEETVREDFTRVHWLRLAMGVAIIGALAAAWLGRSRIARYRASRS